MKAVILAAGRCTRIRQVTKGLPKCLLRFGDRTILDYQIESLFDAGITSLAIVVGYGKEHIMNHVANRHREKGGSISFIENPQFAFTNNIYSLWLARDWVGVSDFIVLNADVLYHPSIILPAVTTRADISVIIDEEWREETMKVIIRDGKVLAMSKAISREQYSGTYVNITTFSRRVCRPFFAAMEALIEEGRVNEFFNVAVERLIARGIPVSFTKTEGLPWAEVDDPGDLWYARTNVYPRLVSELVPGLMLAESEDRLVLAR
jgi:choline kinase